MSEAEQGKQFSQLISIPVEWHIPEHISSRYADNVIVQAKKREMTMSFFEVQLPPFAGTPEENRAFLETVKTLRAECVGKIIVAPGLVPEIIKALQIAYDAYLTTREE